MFQTILHPTDFSEPARYAFELACSLARDHGARLVVLYVEPPVVVYGEGGGLLMRPEGYLEEQQQKLRQFRPQDPQIPVERCLVEGDPADEILAAARQGNCDLIVLGTHGRTGLARLLMGSVAEKVLRNASCPVLTVKTPLAAPSASE